MVNGWNGGMKKKCMGYYAGLLYVVSRNRIVANVFLPPSLATTSFRDRPPDPSLRLYTLKTIFIIHTYIYSVGVQQKTEERTRLI